MLTTLRIGNRNGFSLHPIVTSEEVILDLRNLKMEKEGQIVLKGTWEWGSIRAHSFSGWHEERAISPGVYM